MSKRAKRLADYLEGECGYTIYDGARDCRGCGKTSYDECHKFCPECGTQLPSKTDKKAQKHILDELETAIAHALNEHQADR